MKWRRDRGGMVPEKDEADLAAERFEFDEAERVQFEALQAAMAGNPALQKKVVKRIRKMQRARGMSPTIKSRRK